MNETPLTNNITTKEPSSQPTERKRTFIDFIKGFFEICGKVYNAFGKIIKALIAIFVIGILIAAITGETQTSSYKVIRGTDQLNQIAVVDLNGVILNGTQSGNPFEETTSIDPDHLANVFREMEQNKSLKAVILRINSPGGSVTASDEIYQIIKNYKVKLKIPIWAVYSEVAASGGYYISLAADKIYAPETTLTGSIGVILQTVNFSELSDKYGVKSVTIKSGENKNLLDPFEPVKDEQVALLQTLVDESYQIFLNRIIESRKLSIEVVKPIADGRVLSGIQAKRFGLVDELGYFDKAAGDLVKIIGANDPQFIQYGQGSFLETLLSGTIKKFEIGKIELQLIPENRLKGVPSYIYLN